MSSDAGHFMKAYFYILMIRLFNRNAWYRWMHPFILFYNYHQHKHIILSWLESLCAELKNFECDQIYGNWIIQKRDLIRKQYIYSANVTNVGICCHDIFVSIDMLYAVFSLYNVISQCAVCRGIRSISHLTIYAEHVLDILILLAACLNSIIPSKVYYSIVKPIGISILRFTR